MLKKHIYRLGSQPQRSWSRFKLGLLLFVPAASLILAGSQYWIWLQIPGLLLLPVALFYAAYGYIGIFANRFAQTLNRANPDVFADTQNNRRD